MTTEVTADVVDDEYMEQLRENYQIRMQLVEQPFAKIILVNDQVNIVILDDDGWFGFGSV